MDAKKSIIDALWAIHEGYTVEDMRAIPRSGWHPDNEDDRREEALFTGHAEQVLEHLLAAGWRPPDATD